LQKHIAGPAEQRGGDVQYPPIVLVDNDLPTAAKHVAEIDVFGEDIRSVWRVGQFQPISASGRRFPLGEPQGLLDRNRV
jgi:hypothetical protein